MVLKSRTIRVTQVPLNTTAESLHTSITEWLEDEERELSFSITITHSCNDNNSSQVALVTFKEIEKLPSFLSQLDGESSSRRTVQKELCEGGIISFDMQFLGMTPLYQPENDGETDADIIFIHGLNAHPYGSWKGRYGHGQFWLLDFLSKDLKNCRTMLYGYDSRLESGSTGFHTKRTFAKDFLNEVKLVRKYADRRRPVILVGHSYGGHVIVEALIQLRQKSFAQDSILYELRMCISGIVFFAVPHGGMYVNDLRCMVAELGLGERGRLLDGIEKTSERLLEDRQNFIDCIDDEGYQITSCIEQSQTKGTIKVEDGVWCREGDLHVVVDQNSGMLGLPERLETRIYFNRDHSDITKFDTKDSKYQQVLGNIELYVQRASSAVKRKFGQQSLIEGSVSTSERRSTAERACTSGECASKKDSKPSQWPILNTINDSESDFSPDSYVHRPEAFRKLKECCFEDASEPSSSHKPAQGTVFLHGEPGIGKTTIVRHFVETFKQNWSHIFFINCNSEHLIVSRICEIVYNFLHPGFTPSTERGTLSVFRNWLETNRNWLLLFDNTSREVDLQQFYPRSSNGLIIITSTYTSHPVDHIAQRLGAVSVGCMTETQAMEVFKKSSPGETWDETHQHGIQEIAEVLFYHPLAITLAAGWIRSYEFTSREQRLKEFVERFREGKNLGSCLDRLWTSYSMVIENISQQAREGDTPVARESAEDALALLQFFGYVRNARFAVKTLETCWRNIHRRQERLSNWQRQWHIRPLRGNYAESWTTHPIVESLTLLARCHLIAKFEEKGAFYVSMHPLLHQYVRKEATNMGEFFEPGQWLIAMVTLTESISRNRSLRLTVSSTDPHDARYAVQEHLAYCLQFQKGNEWEMFAKNSANEVSWSDKLWSWLCGPRVNPKRASPTTWATILLRAAVVLSDSGSPNLSNQACAVQTMVLQKMEELVKRAPTDCEAHRLLNQARLDLACTENNMGNLRKALNLRMFAHGSIDDNQSYKGWEKLDVKAALARSYFDNGENGKALNLRKDVLDARRLDQDSSPEVIVDAWRDYAGSLYSVGWRHDALTQREKAVEFGFGIRGLKETGIASLQKLLESRPLTRQGLNLLGDLSASYNSLGRFREARRIREHVAEQKHQLLGEYHMDTLSAKLDLSTTLWELSALSDAYELRKEIYRAVEDLQLPRSHTLVCNSKLQLAESKKCEDFDEALKLIRQVLDDRTADLGPDHSSTLYTADKLVDTLHSSKTHSDHMLAFERQQATLKAILRKCQLEENIESLLARDRLASCYGVLKMHYDAKVEREQLLELQKKFFDSQNPQIGEASKHPHTLNTMSQLASTYLELSSSRCDCFERGHVCSGKPPSESDSGETCSTNFVACIIATPSACGLLDNGLSQNETSPLSNKVLESFSAAPTRDRHQDFKEKFSHDCVTLFRKVLEIRRETLPKTYLQISDSLELLASALIPINSDNHEIKELYEECLDLRTNLLGEEHPRTAKICEILHGRSTSASKEMSDKQSGDIADWLEEVFQSEPREYSV